MDKRFFRGFSTAAICALVAVAASAQTSAVSASNTGPYCAGSTISLYASSADSAAAYSWSGPNNYTSIEQNPTIANADLSNSGSYSVTSEGSTTTTTVVVNPNASITAPAHLTTSDAAKADGPAGASSYAWSISGNGSITGGQNSKTATFAAAAPGLLTLTLNTGCAVATQDVTVDAQPTISVNNVAAQTGPKGTTTPFTFRISLSTPSSQQVSVQFVTSNQIAQAPRDFQFTSGTVLFAPGETFHDVPVTVYGTSSNPMKTFGFSIYGAQNARIQTIYGTTLPVKGKGTILPK